MLFNRPRVMQRLPELTGGTLTLDETSGQTTLRYLAPCPECFGLAILAKNMAEAEARIVIDCTCGRLWTVVMRDFARGGEQMQVIEWLPTTR